MPVVDGMPQTRGRWTRVLGFIVAALIWLIVGINWGLPSRRADAFLFGPAREPWTGRQIVELTASTSDDPDRGADVDANPVTVRDRPVLLNDTDAKRAEIVRRYRLYSYQPDEMITFNALRQMKPGQLQFDPKLYQYGGLWVYPVGAMLKLGSVLRLVELRADVAYYLDHPEAFGRFYIVARLYSALWGVAGAWVVYRLVRHITGGGGAAPLAAAACFVMLPVVVNAAHEAKPHLAGAVLMLSAVLAATNYVQTGRRRWWVTAGALCGAAFGMVLSALPVFVVLPVMAMLRGQRWRDRIVVALAAGVIGIDVYFLANPYVLLHLIRDDSVLSSNLGNSAAMYSAAGSFDAVLNAARLIAEGTSPLLAAAGLFGAIALGWRAWRRRREQSPPDIARRATGLLLAAPVILVLAQFIALAAGKPGEYARFGILPDAFLAIEAVVAAFTFLRHAVWRQAAVLTLLGTTFVFGLACLARFVDDSFGSTTRLEAAQILKDAGGPPAVAVLAEPAPYSLPPIDLFSREIVLLPRGSDSTGFIDGARSLIRPVDAPGLKQAIPPPSRFERMFPARMAWAGKRFEALPSPASIEATPAPRGVKRDRGQ